MQELSKEQEIEIENTIKKEVEKFDTFLNKDELCNEIYQNFMWRLGIANIALHFYNNFDEILESAKQDCYEYIGEKEIQKILNINYYISYNKDSDIFLISGEFEYPKKDSNTFLISNEFEHPKIEKKLIQSSYNNLLYLFEKYPLCFIGCIFDYKIDIPKKSITNIKKLIFINCTFKKEFTLRFKKCLDIFQVSNCIFEKQCVIQVEFKNDAYFNDSHFYDYADFHECKFEKTASFYGVEFDRTPNFSQAIFKGNLNVVNTNLNFDYKDLSERINQEYQAYEKTRYDKDTYQEKTKDKFANDFRDSFRVFKSALIKDNNNLDASDFHKYELYCKEIELEYKKPKKFSKEWIDKWQLYFYRITSDHHTDLLKSFNFLIIIIGIFALLSGLVILMFNYYFGFEPIDSHWYYSKYFYDNHINSFIKDNICLIFFIDLAILVIYISLIFFALWCGFFRKIFIGLGYMLTLIIMLSSPKILIPAMGLFTDKRALLDPLSVIGGIYTIIFAFILYSFIKTIRKNSIVPN